MRMRRLLSLAACLISGLLLAQTAAAQKFPSAPIKIIAPFPPGGATDLYARAVAESFQRVWKDQPAVVENRPGASGVIGADFTARSEPDGHTVLIGAASLHTILPLLNDRMGEAQKHLIPVSLVGINPSYVVVPVSAPVNSLKELIAHLKANPGKLNYASAGAGTSQHVFAELFKQVTDTNIVHVPYRGSGPMMTDLIAGRVLMGIEQGPAALPQVRGGKLKALAVTTPKRSVAMPDVPTVAESGIPGFEAATWFAVTTTASTPANVVRQLNSAIVKGFATSEIRERLLKAGVEPETSTPEALADLIRRDTEKWAAVIKKANIKLEN